MQHTLQLAAPLDVAGVTRILNALRALPGVDGAEATSGATTVDIRFDHNLTSIQELGATAARAGFAEQPRRHAHGGCCGSCGGH
ncbi:MAG: hypothetical protein ACLGI6_09785 [Gammaproteobacteria bacterium]